MTLLTKKTRIFRDTNVALAKRRKTLKTRVQHGRTLSIEDSKAFIALKAKEKRAALNKSENNDLSKVVKITSRRCGVCSETGYNTRTCSKDIESSSESESDKS